MTLPFSYLSVVSTGSVPPGEGSFAYVHVLNTSNPFPGGSGGTTINNTTIVTGGTTSNVTQYVGPAIAAGTNTQDTGTVVFSGTTGGNVTFGLDTAGNLTASAPGGSAPAGAGTAGAITGGSITVNTSGISINLPAYLTTAQPPGAYLTTAALSDHSHTQYLTTAQPPGAYLTTAALSNHVHSLNDIANASGDVLFTFGSGRQIQFQFSNTGTFTTNANKQGLFEIDVQGNLVDGADAVHIHQSDNDPTIDLLHLEAWGTNVTALRGMASASVIAEFNKPLKFTALGTSSTNIGSVPFILGTQMSNSIANLNANFLQGSQASQFQSVGAYLTTAMLSNAGSNFVGLNSALTANGVSASINSSGISLNFPAFLTTAAATNVTTNNMATAERANYFYTSNNTFANSTHTHGGLTINATNLTTGITSASNGLTINLQAAAPGAAAANPQYWACPPWQAGGGGNLITNLSATAMTRRPFFLPFYVTGNLTAQEIHWGMSRAATGNNSFTLNIGIYSYSASSKLNLIASTQNVFVNTDTASQSGLRGFEANLGTGLSTLSPGQYVLAMAFSANGDATSAFNYSLLGGSTSNTLNQTWVAAGSNSYHNYTSHHLMLFYGRYTATSAVIPATVGLADVVAYQASQVPLFFTLGNHV